MNQSTFETGATTAGANNLVLSVMSDGAVYEDRKHVLFAALQGASHRGLTIREIVAREAAKQRATGSKFKAAEISEAARIVFDQTKTAVLEIIRDKWDGGAILCTGRKWWDKVNGNTYFSARIEIPIEGGWHSITVPYQYGYGSHWEHECERVLTRIGFPDNLPLKFTDTAYMRKRDMYQGIFI